MPVDASVQKTVGFVSYRRIDNDEFGGVVDEIRTTLTAIFEARTGQALELFIDRESIGWGEDWREKIRASVRQATVFIPVVTLRYFNSQACLDELLAFESAARNLGVSDLILPIVLFGSDQISVDDERPEVRLVAQLNYKSIEAAWKAGYDSPEWRQAMSDCASSLSDALRGTEDALVQADVNSGRDMQPKGGLVAAAAGLDDIPDDLDLDAMTEQLNFVTAKLTEATGIFQEITVIVNDAFGDQVALAKLTPAQTNARLLGAARDMSDPALRLETAGAEAEEGVRRLDAPLRELIDQLSSLQIPEAEQQLEGLFEGMRSLDGLDEVDASISQFIETIKFISLMNVSVRKSLRPAVRGLRSFQTAFRAFSSWRGLAN